MLRYILFISLLLVLRVYSIPWDGATPTNSGTIPSTGRTPLPTDSLTKGTLDRLLRRDSYPVSVCGWIGGDGGIPAYCSRHSSCVWNTDNHFVGCCATASRACQFYTACVDMDSDQPEGDYNDVYTCRGTSLCFLNTYWSGFSQWGCGAPKDATSVMSSYDGMNTQLSLQIIYTGGSDIPPPDPRTSSRTRSSPSHTSSSSSPDETDSKSTALEKSKVTTIITVLPSGSSNSNSDSDSGSDNNNNSDDYLSTLIVTLTPSATKQEQEQISTTSASSDGLDSEPESSNKPIGAIIGGTLGGVALLIAILALLFTRYRKLRAQPTKQGMSYPFAPGPTAMYGDSPDMTVAGWPTGDSAHASPLTPVVEAEAKVISELPAGMDGIVRARSR